MSFHAYEVSIELVSALKPVVDRIEGAKDQKLADQLRRAASSVSLNLAEGSRKRGASRTNFFRIAAGSAREVSGALDVAEAWGYLKADQLKPARELLDRELAMLWRLAGPPA